MGGVQKTELARPDEAQLLERMGLICATLLLATTFALASLINGGTGVLAVQSAAQTLLKRLMRLGALVIKPRVLCYF